MKPHHFKQLKHKLLKEKDFSNVWTFYMDNFTDLPEFTDMGEPKKSELLEAIIPQICRQLFGSKAVFLEFLLIYVPEYQFFHAPVQANDCIGGMFYFEDVDTGMLAISAERSQAGNVQFSRFSTKSLAKMDQLPTPSIFHKNQNPFDHN
jgi:hypothetical protein